MALETFDRSLYDIGDNDLKEIWDSDFNSPMHDAFGNDQDWAAILDNSQPAAIILNDRMITDAVQSPRIQCEHSYSMVTGNGVTGEDDDEDMDEDALASASLEQDLESECFPAIPMTTATSSHHSEVYIKQEPMSAPSSPQPVVPSLCRQSLSSSPQSLLKQPTIILATRPAPAQQQRCVLFPKVSIKVEPGTTASERKGFSLPPTPPSSTSSDSEGSLSPIHSQQPSSPVGSATAHSSLRRSSSGMKQLANTPLISSQPKGATGVLQLTEEEKRTLLAEGYPIPSRLPLTKTEEKSLKKIRRKIKNKISAQESRRKKKEYMDALEKKVEVLTHENCENKKKVENLESNNKSLLVQLQRLQAMVGDIPNRVARNVSTQTTTTVMMLVLCFALCIGSWHPLVSLPTSLLTLDSGSLSSRGDGGNPKAAAAWVSRDSYSTPSRPSRSLLSILEECEVGSERLGPDPAMDVLVPHPSSLLVDSVPDDGPSSWKEPASLRDALPTKTEVVNTTSVMPHHSVAVDAASVKPTINATA